jgi:hypothetical protein
MEATSVREHQLERLSNLRLNATNMESSYRMVQTYRMVIELQVKAMLQELGPGKSAIFAQYGQEDVELHYEGRIIGSITKVAIREDGVLGGVFVLGPNLKLKLNEVSDVYVWQVAERVAAIYEQVLVR